MLSNCIGIDPCSITDQNTSSAARIDIHIIISGTCLYDAELACLIQESSIDRNMFRYYGIRFRQKFSGMVGIGDVYTPSGRK